MSEFICAVGVGGFSSSGQPEESFEKVSETG